MEIREVINIALSSERIPVDIANEILSYGITEFLSEGLEYSQACDIIARAEISVNRDITQRVTFG